MQTYHAINFGLAQQMREVVDSSMDLIVTSPPYPMIEMWDEIMSRQNPAILKALTDQDGHLAFELMHCELDKVWDEVNRVTKPGSFVCINIGDATRTVNGNFQVFSNHTRIVQYFLKMGFSCLPTILWRKPTNSPNKFMGSGMLPAGAYVTLEHEYILVFRTGGKRVFKSDEEKSNRHQSAFFWEERNQWFSDVWDVRGTNQKMAAKNSRERSGAYPFEIPYRLINMYSAKGDYVLDPFLGTGTTTLAAVLCGRNSIGYEIDENLSETIFENIDADVVNDLNGIIRERLKNHVNFVEKRLSGGETEFKHFNRHYQFPVMTSQEVELTFNFLESVKIEGKAFMIDYSPTPALKFAYIPNKINSSGQQVLGF